MVTCPSCNHKFLNFSPPEQCAVLTTDSIVHGYYPSDASQLEQIASLITSGQSTIASIDDAIDKLTRARTLLTRRRGEHKRTVDTLRSVLSPWRKLPDELLSDIFLRLYKDTNRNAVNGLSPVPGVLSSVCRRWRTVAQGTPAIWIDLPIIQTGKKARKPSAANVADVLNARIRNSGQRLLRLTMSFGNEDKPEQGLSTLPELPSFSHRIRDLTLEMSIPVLQALSGSGCGFDGLRSLSLSLTDGSHPIPTAEEDLPSPPPISLFSQTPHLRIVFVNAEKSATLATNLTRDLDLPYSDLLSFVGKGVDLAQGLTVLATACKLRHFACKFTATAISEAQETAILSPLSLNRNADESGVPNPTESTSPTLQLRHLCLMNDPGLQPPVSFSEMTLRRLVTLCTPSLTKLSLWHFDFGSALLHAMLSPSAGPSSALGDGAFGGRSKLRCLDLRNSVFPRGALTTALADSPTLQELWLTENQIEGSMLEELATAFKAALIADAVSPGSSMERFLPSLQLLHFDENGFSGQISTTHLQDLVIQLAIARRADDFREIHIVSPAYMDLWNQLDGKAADDAEYQRFTAARDVLSDVGGDTHWMYYNEVRCIVMS